MYAFKQSCGNCGEDSFEIFVTKEESWILSRCLKCKSETLIKFSVKIDLGFGSNSEGILFERQNAEKVII